MVTRKQFMKFCDNHKIKYETATVETSRHYFVKYKDVKDPNLDKELVNPSDTFIYVSFTDKEYDETYYIYKPFEKLYDSATPDEFGWYGYDAYGDIHIPEPIHCYEEEELKCLFTDKKFTKNNAIEASIPFNTMDQLEHLYNQFNQFSKDAKDFYYGESFQQAIKTYKNNIKMAKELKLANENLVKKTLQVVKRKYELTEDFLKGDNDVP